MHAYLVNKFELSLAEFDILYMVFQTVCENLPVLRLAEWVVVPLAAKSNLCRILEQLWLGECEKKWRADLCANRRDDHDH